MGKAFVPHSPAVKANRRKTIGSASTKGGRSPKSKTQNQPEIPEDSENEEVVEVVDGEEGDMVYLESKELDVDIGPLVSLISTNDVCSQLTICRLPSATHSTRQRRHQS